MKLAIILPSWTYDVARVQIATRTMDALQRTDTSKFEAKPRLHLLLKAGVDYYYPVEGLGKTFDLTVEGDPALVSGVEQTLAYGTTKLFNEGAEYVSWVQDDTLVHPDWMNQLDALITRHPDARAWSIYRSANVQVHENIREDENGDVQVKSIGHVMTISHSEWVNWGVPWMEVHDGGITMDLVHPCSRPGERWVTGKSYADHIAKHGKHMRPEIPEYAVSFQGTEKENE